MRLTPALLLSPLLAASAFAQTPSPQPSASPAPAMSALAMTVGVAGNRCLNTRNDTTVAPEEGIKICQTSATTIRNAMDLSPNATQADKNIALMQLSFSELAVGGFFVKIDKVRSTRVCTQTEASWAPLTRIVDAASPANYQTAFKSMRDTTAAAVRKCRSEKGTPPGAPPVPAE